MGPPLCLFLLLRRTLVTGPRAHCKARMTSSGDLEFGDTHKDPTPSEVSFGCSADAGWVLQRMQFAAPGSAEAMASGRGLSACCGLGALRGEPRPVLEGTCPAHPPSAFTTVSLRRCGEASPAPTLPSVVPAGRCLWPRSRLLRSSSDYETGSEEEDGWPAGGAGGGPSVCAAAGRGH